MGWHPDRDGWQPGADLRSNGRSTFQDQGEWSGPELSDERIGQVRHINGDTSELRVRLDVHNKRVVSRSAFGLENAANGLGFQRISAESVDRFCWKGHQFTSQ